MTVPPVWHDEDRWPVLQWRWRLWQARRRLRMAEMIYRRRPNLLNKGARDRAGDQWRQIDIARPPRARHPALGSGVGRPGT